MSWLLSLSPVLLGLLAGAPLLWLSYRYRRVMVVEVSEPAGNGIARCIVRDCVPPIDEAARVVEATKQLDSDSQSIKWTAIRGEIRQAHTDISLNRHLQHHG